MSQAQWHNELRFQPTLALMKLGEFRRRVWAIKLSKPSRLTRSA